MQEKEVKLGVVRKVLELIASKGWVTSPILAECPLLVVRASNAYGEDYTNSHLQTLHQSLQRGRKLPPFESMTSEDFLEALHPISMREAA